MPRVRRLDDYFRRLNEEAQRGSLDLEALIRRVAEEAARAALEASAPSGAGRGEWEERVEARLEGIERRLERLEKLVAEQRGVDPGRLTDAIAAAVAQAVAGAVQRYCSQQRGGGRGDPAWLRLVLERLGERGYLLSSELPPEARRELDPSLLRSRGVVVKPLGGGVYLLASGEALREFQELLEGLREVGDEYEAEARLGRYGKLFRVLRGEGLIYYAGPGRGWRLGLKL